MRLHVALTLILAAGCSDTIPPQPSPIAGTYQTAVSLQSSTCTGITVQNNPTTIVHSEGAPSFTLEHAGQTYSGALDIANSTFTTSAKAITVGTTTHTLTIVGVFTNTGFTADVTAVVSGSASCQYVVHWQGTR